MTEMPSVTFDTPEALYGHLRPKEKELVTAQIPFDGLDDGHERLSGPKYLWLSQGTKGTGSPDFTNGQVTRLSYK